MAAIPLDELWRLEDIQSSPLGEAGYFPLTLNVVGMMDGQKRAMHLVFSLQALQDLIGDLGELLRVQLAVLSTMDQEPSQDGHEIPTHYGEEDEPLP